MFVLATAAALAILVTGGAVALRAHRALRQWHRDEERQFDLLLRDLEQVREAIRYTWFVLHRPRLVGRGR